MNKTRYNLKEVFVFGLAVIFTGLIPKASEGQHSLSISHDQLADQMKGGLVGQLFGNLNGLVHEMTYIDEPGSVETYTPDLSNGAWTNDDTDIEWIYVYAMQESDRLFLSPEHIMKLWKEHIVDRSFFATGYSKRLMEIGIKPPLSGNRVLNPFADFNIAGHFLSESFGMIAPGLPETAGRIGLHYTTVCIDGEPAQMTQFFTAIYALAFFETNLDRLLDAGLASIDPSSSFYEVIQTTRQMVAENPTDWRRMRRLLKERYSKHNGELRDRNGYELNGAATVAALLYGKGDFAESLRLSFNFGWDADNSAASVGTILGTIKGYQWMEDQGWKVKDIYYNMTRLNMPLNETLSSFADRLTHLAVKTLVEEGKAVVQSGPEGTSYTFKQQSPVNILPVYPMDHQRDWMRIPLDFEIDRLLTSPGSKEDKARAVYFALAAGTAKEFREKYPDAWKQAVQDFQQFPRLGSILLAAEGRGIAAATTLRKSANEMGIEFVALPRLQGPQSWRPQ
ncbi:ADP-ribosylglycohydrolase family protein [Opitutia bacterium ISCC 51]|nr:ADP-ribosylglycohydrolase family protein [Opitutae bacterium ISCC 51]QXD28167.1 ADP-ribosylglycohydrolase family protein [Opitutae bacterium ISCC 52]